ncbi:hypothetical protein CYLTODRAFT_447633 [Cylindrobasidium torrendii FP15055 ss-10]|uniref:F-box domain-containing protein n=1 Tax=Cylindrobasidium torrendii FP15055 ss-10 TaxID=1314674 RepID=A0A0D7AWD8_9AGAR|nr:hypothetical protein CYLTODRAFT_447633 [Cylindrobasidium torrendii FP15055 ss-10]
MLGSTSPSSSNMSMDSGGPILEVLLNPDLLGAICEEIYVDWSASKPHPPGSAHPLVSLALTCDIIADVALEILWMRIPSLYVLLCVLPLVPDENNQQTIPANVDEDSWKRFAKYASRVRYLACDRNSFSSYSPTVYLALSEAFSILLPNLCGLNVDMSFATDMTVTHLLYSKSSLTDIELLFSGESSDVVYRAVRGAAVHNAKSLESLSILQSTYVETNVFTTVCAASAFHPCRDTLKRLVITSHPIDFEFFLELSRFPSLTQLEVRVIQSIPQSGRDDTAGVGFPKLETFRVEAGIDIALRLLHVFKEGTLRRIRFKDTSNLAYVDRSNHMLDFHEELKTRFSLESAELSYESSNHVAKEHKASTWTVFAPFCKMPCLRHLSYRGELCIWDSDMTARAIADWKNLQTLYIYSPHTMDHHALPAIAVSCPALIELGATIHFPEDQEPVEQNKSIPFSSHRLMVLDAMNSLAPKPSRVATYLDTLFPSLAFVKGGTGWDAVWDILEYACHVARAQERARQRAVDAAKQTDSQAVKMKPPSPVSGSTSDPFD